MQIVGALPGRAWVVVALGLSLLAAIALAAAAVTLVHRGAAAPDVPSSPQNSHN
jgi:hypothetical protein